MIRKGDLLDCENNIGAKAGETVTVYRLPMTDAYRLSYEPEPLDSFGARHFVVARGTAEGTTNATGGRATVRVTEPRANF